MGKKKKNTRIRLIVFILFILLIFAGYLGSKYYKNIIASNVVVKDKEAYLFIKRSDNQDSVANQLITRGLIKDIPSFKWMLEKKNYQGRNIVPGKYKIKNGWSNNRLINHLRAGNGRIEVKVRFNQSRDLYQLSGQLVKEIQLDSTDAIKWLTNIDSINRYGFNKQTIISMFIPNTYFVDWDVTMPELMKRMGVEYKKFWSGERSKKAKSIGLSQSEVTTLASIVYWETKVPEDMPKVAGVYINRLKKGWPLQADPTLIFASGDYTIKRVLNKHKEINSPYNTYKNKGLPPGPIIIPPIKYIDAVLNYEKHNYMFFVAKADFSGYSNFSTTLSQHNKYAREYQRALNRRGVFK